MVDEKRKKNNIISWLICILVLGHGLVLANTSKTQFDMLGKSNYYTFNQYSLYCNIGLFVETFILGWYGWLTIIRNRYDLETKMKRVYILCLLGMIVCLTTLYSKLGPIWHSDPTHSLPFYNNFWSDSTMDFNKLPKQIVNNTNIYLRGSNPYSEIIDKKWAYILGDILVRIWGILMMLVPIILLLCICVMVTLWWVGRNP